MSTQQSKLERTQTTLQRWSESGAEYIERRNMRLPEKSERNFTRAEAISYLDINGRTIDKYVEKVGIDPRRHEDAAWNLSLSEIYAVRDELPDNLRKDQPFKRNDNQKCQVVIVQNQKGGVGKTVSTVTLASGIATEFHEEFRVGIIDLDPQHNASMYYAPQAGKQELFTAGDLMRGNYELSEGESEAQFVSECFVKTTIPNLRILPASQADRSLDGWFVQSVTDGNLDDPYGRLKRIIDLVSHEFDVIFIDTPPATTFPVYNAYYAATSMILPITLAENDMDATCSYLEFLPEIYSVLKANGHEGYDFQKILLTNHRDGTVTEDLLFRVTQLFGEDVYKREFRNSEAVKLCTSLLSTIFDMSKSEYPKTKTSFATARQNAFECCLQVLVDLKRVWAEQAK